MNTDREKWEWGRRLTDDQAAALQGLLDSFGVGIETLERPDPSERIPVTMHLTPGVGAYMQQLAALYGCRSKSELARLVVLGWLQSTKHPGRVRKPAVFR